MSKRVPKMKNLHQLPVPTLSETIEKYFISVQPFLDSTELEQTKNILNKFLSENGEGPKLQKLLIEKAKNCDNWLSDWWLSVCYLAYRDPVVVYLSPAMVFPLQKFSNENKQIEYAAKLINAALGYKDLIESGQIPTDMMGEDPMDMNQYYRFFGTCRVPRAKEDYLEYNPQSKHIIIARNNNFFKLEVIGDSGEILNTEKLIFKLQEIIKESESPGPEIGVLTTEHRDIWAKSYQSLTLDFVNLKSVREIETSLFLVCLDKALSADTKNCKTLASKQLIHGGGSLENSANRWFDKTIQFVVSEGGTVGIIYEHSHGEGQPIAAMTDHIINQINNETLINCNKAEFDGSLEKLNFNINEKVCQLINSAKVHIDKVVQNFEIETFQMKKFGKDFIKLQKMSPDSFIQMALQLAFYKMYKTPGAHYEAASTRKFIYGRTETIRSCSNESVYFAKAMLDSNTSNEEKIAALRKAVATHKKYVNEAVNGFGVNRHLLGLKLIALENNMPIPELFNHSSFQRSKPVILTSSQVASNSEAFMCFGSLNLDGYSCCYNPRRNDIIFAICAFADSPKTSALKFKDAVEDSLKDMYNLFANS